MTSGHALRATSGAKVYRWIEFANKGEQITEFDESHFQLEGLEKSLHSQRHGKAMKHEGKPWNMHENAMENFKTSQRRPL